jgi:hypothetical protein
MKKLTLSIGLLAAIMSVKAQDTSCTYFTGKEVYEFDYKADTVIGVGSQTSRFYEIDVEYRQVLCLDLSDHKNRVRKVIITYPDGSTSVEVLDSEDNVYFTGFGPLRVQVGKPKFLIACK